MSCELELIEMRKMLAQMADQSEHLLNILERKAEQEWSYDYMRDIIARARDFAPKTDTRHVRPAEKSEAPCENSLWPLPSPNGAQVAPDKQAQGHP